MSVEQKPSVPQPDGSANAGQEQLSTYTVEVYFLTDLSTEEANAVMAPFDAYAEKRYGMKMEMSSVFEASGNKDSVAIASVKKADGTQVGVGYIAATPRVEGRPMRGVAQYFDIDFYASEEEGENRRLIGKEIVATLLKQVESLIPRRGFDRKNPIAVKINARHGAFVDTPPEGMSYAPEMLSQATTVVVEMGIFGAMIPTGEVNLGEAYEKMWNVDFHDIDESLIKALLGDRTVQHEHNDFVGEDGKKIGEQDSFTFDPKMYENYMERLNVLKDDPGKVSGANEDNPQYLWIGDARPQEPEQYESQEN